MQLLKKLYRTWAKYALPRITTSISTWNKPQWQFTTSAQRGEDLKQLDVVQTDYVGKRFGDDVVVAYPIRTWGVTSKKACDHYDSASGKCCGESTENTDKTRVEPLGTNNEVRVVDTVLSGLIRDKFKKNES